MSTDMSSIATSTHDTSAEAELLRQATVDPVLPIAPPKRRLVPKPKSSGPVVPTRLPAPGFGGYAG
jgi:hypothetical protein